MAMNANKKKLSDGAIVAIIAGAVLAVTVGAILAVTLIKSANDDRTADGCPIGQRQVCGVLPGDEMACSCIDNDKPTGIYKPMIYLYPEKKMEVFVKLGYPNKTTTVYPDYNDGWEVTAHPCGKLTDANGREYYGLYWEGEGATYRETDEGFVVKGEDSASFLEEKLAILGLNEREANEFIVYWLPKMNKNKYNYVRFAAEAEINEDMPLKITPKPDTTIRIMMVLKPLDATKDVKEQELTSVERKGFTVVEWGGTVLDEKIVK